MWHGEGQKSWLGCFFGQNIQWGTTIEWVGHTWVVGPPDKGKNQQLNEVFHTSEPEEEEGMIIGSWIQLVHL